MGGTFPANDVVNNPLESRSIWIRVILISGILANGPGRANNYMRWRCYPQSNISNILGRYVISPHTNTTPLSPSPILGKFNPAIFNTCLTVILLSGINSATNENGICPVLDLSDKGNLAL